MAIGAKEFQEISQRVEALEKLTKELSGRLWEAERQLACLNEVEQAHSESERPSGDEENEMNETSEQPSGLSPAERARRTANRVKAKARKTVDAEKLDEWYAAVDRRIEVYSEQGKTELEILRPRMELAQEVSRKDGVDTKNACMMERADPSIIPDLISLEPYEVVNEIKDHYKNQGYVVTYIKIERRDAIRLSWK